MILSLPKEKKIAFFNAATPEVRTNEASKDAEKGFLEGVVNWCKGAANTVWEFVKENKEEVFSWGYAILREVFDSRRRPSPGRRR